MGEELYVPPASRVIGSRWDSILNPQTQLSEAKLVQSTCEYVSIIDTQKTIFLNEKFAKVYFDYKIMYAMKIDLRGIVAGKPTEPIPCFNPPAMHCKYKFTQMILKYIQEQSWSV